MPKSNSNKHFVFGSEFDKTIERAEESCMRRGTTLRKVLEQTILDQSKIKTKDKDAFIQEIETAKLDWCPSRSTLYTMRKSGDIVEGEHYVVNDSLVFYRLDALRRFCKKNYPHIERMNQRKNEVVTG